MLQAFHGKHFNKSCNFSDILRYKLWSHKREVHREDLRDLLRHRYCSLFIVLFSVYILCQQAYICLLTSLVAVFCSGPWLLIRTISVSCVTWCLVPTWWQDHTMKAKSMQKICVNKAFSPQASVGCVMEKYCSDLNFNIYVSKVNSVDSMI